MTIYVDVLVVVNLIIDFFLLVATAKFFNIHIKRKKIILASLIGAAYSLVILIPNFNVVISIISSICIAGLMIFVSFGFKTIASFLKKICVLYAFSFIFSGVVFLLNQFINLKNTVIKNGIVYFNISPIILILFTGVAYIAIRGFSRLTQRGTPKDEYCNAIIKLKDKSCDVLAKVDTGMNLVEPFSNTPVIVVDPISLNSIIRLDEGKIENKEGLKIRIVPFHALGKDGALQAFKPDSLTIYKDGKKEEKEAYVAICKTGTLNGEFDALINPVIIE